jgi:hypothetical protein
MRARMYSTVAAVTVLAMSALVQQAGATTISISSQDTTVLPLTAFVTNPVSDSGPPTFTLSTTQSIPGQQLSPFATDFSNPQTTLPFSVLNSALPSGGTSSPGFAIYNLSPNSTTFSLLWGSPDSYNTLQFFSALGGPGVGSTLLGTFTGTDLAIQSTGFDLVSFLATGGTIGSVELSDSGSAAFEYANVSTGGTLSQTPLPGALPLFAGGLGLIGLFSRRRKNKAAAALAA